MTREHDAAVIAVENLSVRRGGRPVLRQVSFQINRGECVAIVGPNGAGKSTLMLAMMGLLPIAEGRILLHARELHDFGGRRALAREMAYVPQQYEGFTGFTVRDMVAAGRYAHQGALGLHSRADRAAIEEALGACGLTDLSQRITSQLSGGERQKVWLAAAIAQQSPILLLDEPTTALDPQHQTQLIQMLSRLSDAGRTLLIICHDLNLAAALKARVLALRAGALLYDEPFSEFFDDRHMQEVFSAEFQRLTVEGGPRVLLRV